MMRQSNSSFSALSKGRMRSAKQALRVSVVSTPNSVPLKQKTRSLLKPCLADAFPIRAIQTPKTKGLTKLTRKPLAKKPIFSALLVAKAASPLGSLGLMMQDKPKPMSMNMASKPIQNWLSGDRRKVAAPKAHKITAIISLMKMPKAVRKPALKPQVTLICRRVKSTGPIKTISNKPMPQPSRNTSSSCSTGV